MRLEDAFEALVDRIELRAGEVTDVELSMKKMGELISSMERTIDKGREANGVLEHEVRSLRTALKLRVETLENEQRRNASFSVLGGVNMSRFGLLSENREGHYVLVPELLLMVLAGHGASIAPIDRQSVIDNVAWHLGIGPAEAMKMVDKAFFAGQDAVTPDEHEKESIAGGLSAMIEEIAKENGMNVETIHMVPQPSDFSGFPVDDCRPGQDG